MTGPRTGLPLRRIEDPSLVTGSARFTADIENPALDGALHVAFVRSPVAAGRIVEVDPADALAIPGVVAVLTGTEVEQLAPFAMPFDDRYTQPLLPAASIGFAGQAVAAVAAETAALAVDAAESVLVDIEPADPVLDLEEAEARRPVGGTAFATSGDSGFADAADAADLVVELRQLSPRQLPTPIEGRSIAAVVDGSRLLVWSATQTPHAYRANLSKLLEIPVEAIRVMAQTVGGGFGGKVSRTAEEYLVPLLATRTGRPVRWNETRSENFATATQGRGELITVALAGTNDGRITGIRSRLVKDSGAYPLVGAVLAAGYTSKIANGCYDVDTVEFSSIAVLTNKPPTSAYRGAGRSPYIGALERAVDRFAAELSLDPAEVRRRNLIQPENMPYANRTGGIYDEADYPGDLERSLEAVGYDRLRAEQAERRAAGDRSALGIGIACYNHMTTGGGGEEASVTVGEDGKATVVTGTTSQGHGHATTWAQIASDVLGIAVEDIAVVEGDTDAIGSGVGAVGSRSLQTAGMAVHRAATDVVEQARSVAADLLEAAVGDVVLSSDLDAKPHSEPGSEPGGTGFHVVGTPARALGWAEIAANTPASEVTCGDFYDTEGRNTFPSGVHVAVVEVDTETGLVRLDRLVGVDDAGTVVNPLIVEGQIHGGMASAVGQVLGEVIVHDGSGNQLTSSLMDYPIPTADQLPSFEVVPAETASSFNTLGFKGVGESGTVGATGAVHNAAVDAVAHLGVRHLDLPCTPERMWRAIEQARVGNP